MYDGLGRLVRIQSPYPDPDIGASTSQRRSERLHYDGIRRVQEILLDPVSDTQDAAMVLGDPAAQAALAANPDLDGEVATLGTEQSQSGGGGGGGGPPSGSVLNREYVWGPGDRGVDELLVQYDVARAPSWPLQDAGLDAIALCDLGGGTGQCRTRSMMSLSSGTQPPRHQRGGPPQGCHPPLRAGVQSTNAILCVTTRLFVRPPCRGAGGFCAHARTRRVPWLTGSAWLLRRFP